MMVMVDCVGVRGYVEGSENPDIQFQTNLKSPNRIEANSGGGKLADLDTSDFWLLVRSHARGAVKLEAMMGR